MSNTTVNQRNQYERATARGERREDQARLRAGRLAFNVVAALIAAALSYGALTLIDGWSQWVVLGAIVVTTSGVMIAVSPARRA